MSFKEIIGQDSAVALLKQAYRLKRIAHAYVFLGPEGVGKAKAASSFASLLVCENVRAECEPCGVCSSCLKAKSSNHPDIQWVWPDGQFVKIDAIREACRRLSLKGFEASAKVLIVPQADSLNEESSNALLKTLEEPSQDTVIILIATSLKRILGTIASRCQRVIFHPLDPEVLEKLLSEAHGIARAEAAYLARIGQGSIGEALRYHEAGLFARKNKMIETVLDPRKRLDEAIDLAKQERAEKTEKIEETLLVLSTWFRDLLIAKIRGVAGEYINVDRKEDIVRDAASHAFSDIEARVSAIAETRRSVERNANARISLTKLRADLWKQ